MATEPENSKPGRSDCAPGKATEPPRTPKSVQPLLALLKTHFFNRTDVLAFKPKTGGACPLEPGEKLDDVLLSHLVGKKATAWWRSLKHPEGGVARGPFRLGSYSPALDGTTRHAVIDCDGGAHSRPLADPLVAALAIQAALVARGLTAYLERSKSGDGWHVWVFFSEPVPAPLVRRVFLAVLPADLPLRGGGCASARTTAGLELFPKQDSIEHTPAKVGNQVWLPWYFAADWPCNEFHRLKDGRVEPYRPEAFETVAPPILVRLEREVCPPPAEQTAPRVRAQTDRGAGGNPFRGAAGAGDRVSAGVLLRHALERAGLHGRNSTGFWLGCQFRDNGYAESEAEPFLRDYQRAVEGDGDHPYALDEALDSLRNAYMGSPREPWRRRKREENPEGPAPSFCPSSSVLEEEVEQKNSDKRKARPYPSQLVQLKLPPPASCCKRNPGHYLKRRSGTGERRVSRFGCHCWSCRICCRRLAYRFALHVARKLLAAEEKGQALALSAEVPEADRSATHKALTRAKANYARVLVAPGRYRFCVAAPPGAVLPAAFAPATLEEAGEAVGVWFGGLQPPPKDESEPPAASAANPFKGGSKKKKKQTRPVCLSRPWKLEKEPRSGEWLRDGTVQCRESSAVVAVLRKFGLPVARVEESGVSSAGTAVAWMVEFRIPPRWKSDKLREFEEALLDAQDPAADREEFDL
jgi:hypothetical protein